MVLLALVSAGVGSSGALRPLSGDMVVAGVWEWENARGLVYQISVFNGGSNMNLLNYDAGDPESVRGQRFIGIEIEWAPTETGSIMLTGQDSQISFDLMMDVDTGERYLRVLEGSVFPPGDYRWIRMNPFE